MQAFPKHDMIRLRSDNFVQWQYQLKLLLDAYELNVFVDVTVEKLSRMVFDTYGRSSINPSFTFYVK